VSSTAWESRVAEIADQLVGFVLERRPTLGSTRLVCVDGRAGSGKTTLGQALVAAAAPHCTTRLLHMDDMYAGWSGLGAVSGAVKDDLIDPLLDDLPGRYRRYDWHRERFVEWCTVEPVDVLVLEGVGSGGLSYARQVTTLVWVEAPRELRLARGVERDGVAQLPHWLAWMDDEEALFAREDTSTRADVTVDGTGADTAGMHVR